MKKWIQIIPVVIVVISGCATVKNTSEADRATLKSFLGRYQAVLIRTSLHDGMLQDIQKDINLDVTDQDGTLAIYTDKDIAGSGCDSKIGRMTSLELSNGASPSSLRAEFEFVSNKCEKNVNARTLTLRLSRSEGVGRLFDAEVNSTRSKFYSRYNVSIYGESKPDRVDANVLVSPIHK